MEGFQFPTAHPTAAPHPRATYPAGLRSVRKPPTKPWRRPVEPPPPKVYHVDPHGFRRLVQHLTGAPKHPWPVRYGVPLASFSLPEVTAAGEVAGLTAAPNTAGAISKREVLLSPSLAVVRVSMRTWFGLPILSSIGSTAALEFASKHFSTLTSFSDMMCMKFKRSSFTFYLLLLV
ncbi:hypothetical protein KFK09_027624 [Dendrobium nobile]|uniref:VQ domain-containing protein n=1 Tax=Dendrobium nobile TaxID=94219 RepID=A0A8T3AA98_DENNO|nr:hypothetical protein KFK09_027624 [Dendrobium nobile]